MRFKALRHQPSDAARKSGYDNEGQLPDTLPDSRSRPGADAQRSRQGQNGVEVNCGNSCAANHNFPERSFVPCTRLLYPFTRNFKYKANKLIQTIKLL